MSIVDRQEATVKMSKCESIIKYTRYTLLVAGTFDIRNGRNLSFKLYKTWAILSQAYYSLFFLSFMVGMIDELMDGEDEETMNVNMQTFLLIFLLLMKLLLSYTRRIRDRIREVYQFENDITHDDLECMLIYNENCRYNYRLFYISTSMSLATGSLYMFNGFNGWKLMNVENSTESKSLILVGWFPFDLGIPIYFKAAYFFQWFAGLWVTWYTLTFDPLFISMVNFATARADILGYKFENFEKYSDGRSESKFHCLQNIVMEHQDLIRYVEDVNESLKWYFFGEFLIKSYHISLSLLNVINATKEDIAFYLAYLMFLLIQVGFLYYHANELSLISTNLSVRIFQSNWYDQFSGVVRSLSIMMARVQRPLVLTIGNIRVIDNELFVDMIKAGYTFLLYQKIWGSSDEEISY